MAVAVAVEFAVILSLYFELENYRRNTIDLRLSEVYTPVKGGEDLHVIRVILMNLGVGRVEKLEVKLIWMRGHEVLHSDAIEIHNVAPRAFYSYSYTFTFEGAADRIIYSYGDVTRTATHGQ